MEIKDFFKLIRIEQWYKNIIIFVPLVFSLNLFNLSLFIKVILGFISISFISSSYYIINDLKDIEKDRNHTEKCKRPMASKKISKEFGIAVCIVLFLLSLIMALYLSRNFFYSIILLFLSSQLYTFLFRDIAFLDIIIIAVNFVIRAISGFLILNIPISYWILLFAFFLSIFLVSGKRITEVNLRGLENYRPCLKKDHAKVFNLAIILSANALLILFSVYCIMFYPLLLLTLPISFYLLILYFDNACNSPEKIRNPENFIFDKKILFTFLLWLVLVLIGLYFH
ncbi:MAG: UbiA family prenyltransferase [Nanoarchaeota archaeon]